MLSWRLRRDIKQMCWALNLPWLIFPPGEYVTRLILIFAIYSFWFRVFCRVRAPEWELLYSINLYFIRQLAAIKKLGKLHQCSRLHEYLLRFWDRGNYPFAAFCPMIPRITVEVIRWLTGYQNICIKNPIYLILLYCI